MIYRPPGPGARPPTGADADTLARALDSLCAAPASAPAAAGGDAAAATATTTAPTTARAHVSFLKQVPARAPDLQVIARPVFMADLWAVTLAEAPGRALLLQRGVGGGAGGGGAAGGAGAGSQGGAAPVAAGSSRRWGPKLAEVDDTARALLERRCEYRARGGVTVKAQAWRTGGGGGGGGGGQGGGDLRLRLLEAVAPGSPALALAVEVEYAPASSLEQAGLLLDELAGVLQKAVREAGGGGAAAAAAAGGPAAAAARLDLLRPPYAEYAAAGQLTPGAYGPAHAALAYAELVAQAQQQQAQQQAQQQQAQQQNPAPQQPTAVPVVG